MLARNLRKVKSTPALRSLHNSVATPKPVRLLNVKLAEYTPLTVPMLKDRCRALGLKRTGRKAELVERLASYDVRRTMASASEALKDTKEAPKPKAPKPKAEAAETRKPEAAETKAQPQERTTTEHTTTTTTEPTTSTKSTTTTTEPTTTTASTTTEPTTITTSTTTAPTTKPTTTEPTTTPTESDSLPKRDKFILYGLAASVVLWWTGGKRKSRKSHKK